MRESLVAGQQLETLAQATASSSVAHAGQPAWRASSDLVGVSASVACAIHCAAMPFVISFLPWFGLTFLADESFHQWMAGFCAVIAMAAFIRGWRVHRRYLPAAIAAVGLAVITSAAFGLSGQCCATCAASTSEAAAASSGMDAAASPPPSAEGACCEHCALSHASDAAPAADLAREPATAVANVASNSSGSISGLFLAHAAWWTPLGGLLLVTGHVLNHRSTCRKSCCPPASAQA
jgi:hypothetical protein